MNGEQNSQQYSNEFIQKVLQDNMNLSEQVKRLVKTEYALYNTQEELDNQITLYKGLYETGKKITTALKIKSIFNLMGEFIIEQLNFGGYFLFKREKQFLYLELTGGCTSAAKKTLKTLPNRWLKTIIEILTVFHDVCFTTEHIKEHPLVMDACLRLTLEEFIIYPFYSCRKKTPSYYLVVGNPSEKEFFSPMIPDSITMIGLRNLVSLVDNALNNAIHYQQLVEERKQLENKVKQRTKDLNSAMVNLKELNTRLERLSFTDELTGLYNRRGFYLVGEKYVTMAQRKKNSIMILYCDLDKFKPINDRYGHKEGDIALRDTAAILTGVFRDYDIVSRFGGDEFVLLLDNTTATDFIELKTRLDNYIYAYNLQSKKDYAIQLSYGYSVYDPAVDSVGTLEELIEKADKMLYLNKKIKNSDSE